MFLTDTEVDGMCEGRTQPAAMVKRLRSFGLIVNVKPNGRPLVVRAHAQAVLSGAPAAPEVVGSAAAPAPRAPDRAGLLLAFGKKKAA
jgi:hypothetical protein